MFCERAYDDIDWKRGYERLDKELQRVAPTGAAGPRRADLLFKVWLLSGKEARVLIHIEIQAQRDVTFPERIFDYNHRFKDVYGRPVASFAILADDDPGWRPGRFYYGLWGSGGEFHYPTVKLLDFASRIGELVEDPNPFAMVVLAHLKARATANDRARRREWKVRLLKGLYQRGWEPKDVRQLIRTIDWFLTLPSKNDRLVRKAIESDELEKQMPYITSFEKIAAEEGEARGEARGINKGVTLGRKEGVTLGRKEGEARGEARGLKDGIALALKLKVGQRGKLLIAKVRQTNDVKTLRRVTRSIDKAATIDDVRKAFSARA
jgi:hypothetical protein